MDLQERKNREDMLLKMKPISKSRSDSSKLFMESKSALFAEAPGSPLSGEQSATEGSISSTQQTMGVLNETHEKLLERGEKLSKMSERSEQMANQANDFAKMAKLLNDQQKSRWF
jgi:hypothetical protein